MDSAASIALGYVSVVHCVQGCFAKLSSFMESNFLMIGGVAMAFSFLQVSYMAFLLPWAIVLYTL